MHVSVRLLAGPRFTIEVEPTDTIATVKAKTALQYGYPWQYMNFVWGGRTTDNRYTVGDYNIPDGDFIILMMRTRPRNVS